MENLLLLYVFHSMGNKETHPDCFIIFFCANIFLLDHNIYVLCTDIKLRSLHLLSIVFVCYSLEITLSDLGCLN